MDLDFSQDSFAFSDIAPPSHVSGLESFSDFDASECSEVSFADVAPNKDVGSKDRGAFVGKKLTNEANVSVEVERHQDSGGSDRLVVLQSFYWS